MNWQELARPVEVPYGSRLWRSLCSNSLYVAQEKVDGMRVLASATRMISRHGREVLNVCPARYWPEGWEFDGELRRGRLYLFDVVGMPRKIHGFDVKEMPLAWRWAQLWDKACRSEDVRVVRVSRDLDKAFVEWTREGAEGIVVKSLSDQYPPLGGAEWYKVKR